MVCVKRERGEEEELQVPLIPTHPYILFYLIRRFKKCEHRYCCVLSKFSVCVYVSVLLEKDIARRMVGRPTIKTATISTGLKGEQSGSLVFFFFFTTFTVHKHY